MSSAAASLPHILTSPPPLFDLGSYPPAETLRLLARYLNRRCMENETLSPDAGPAGLQAAETPPSMQALSDRADPTRHNTPFHARAAPGIDLEAYLARILKYCPCANEVFLSLVMYARRLEATSNMRIDRFNVHRICISAVVVASKFFSDVFYTNTRYAKVGGLPVAELNALEIRFMELLEYRMHVTLPQLQEIGDFLLQSFRPRPTSMAMPPSSFPSAPPTPTVPMDIAHTAWRAQVETPVSGTMPVYHQQQANSGASTPSSSVLNYTRSFSHHQQPLPRPLSAGSAVAAGAVPQRRDTWTYSQQQQGAQPYAPMHHQQQSQLVRSGSSGSGSAYSAAVSANAGMVAGRHLRAMSYNNGPISAPITNGEQKHYGWPLANTNGTMMASAPPTAYMQQQQRWPTEEYAQSYVGSGQSTPPRQHSQRSSFSQQYSNSRPGSPLNNEFPSTHRSRNYHQQGYPIYNQQGPIVSMQPSGRSSFSGTSSPLGSSSHRFVHQPAVSEEIDAALARVTASTGAMGMQG